MKIVPKANRKKALTKESLSLLYCTISLHFAIYALSSSLYTSLRFLTSSESPDSLKGMLLSCSQRILQIRSRLNTMTLFLYLNSRSKGSTCLRIHLTSFTDTENLDKDNRAPKPALLIHCFCSSSTLGRRSRIL